MKIVEIGADAAKLAGLQIDLLQKLRSENSQITLAHLEWFLKMTKEERDRLSRITIVADKRFELLNSFELTVPMDYIHETQLASFNKKYKYKKEFYYFNNAITDENFAKVSDKLVPGKTYSVKIFGINQIVSSEDILALLKKQQGMRFFGAQGASLVYHLKKQELPIGKFTISIDEKDALWKDADGDCGVPLIYRRSDGDWGFDLGGFGGDWYGSCCVLCFCDLSG